MICISKKGKRGKERVKQPAPTDREPRKSTAAKTLQAKDGKGPKSQKGRTPKRSKKCDQTFEILTQIFEIGVEDGMQSRASLEFLEEQVKKSYSTRAGDKHKNCSLDSFSAEISTA